MKKQKEMKNKKKHFKKESGITLIALVITIVVLIILATVSINMILNDNGIMGAAELSKELYQNAAQTEQEELALLEGELDKYSSNVKMVMSEDNKEVPVPKGYVASTVDGEKSVSTGFVIKKGSNGAATEGVNEFVWVPVSDESFNAMFATETCNLSGTTGAKTEYYSKLKVRTGDTYAPTKPGTTSGVREPDLVTAYDNDSNAVQAGYTNLATMVQGFVNDYANMRASIQKYKGFYIGRYELTGTVENPTVQAGKALLAGSGSDQAGNWYGLYKACRNVAKSGEKVTSTMIWGCQWDETMNWLKATKFAGNGSAVDSDSSSWGNSGARKDTGSNKENWNANNVYDLAGNCTEWTQEAYLDQYRVYRGGVFGDFAASDRVGNIPSWSSDSSTRVTLYINP